MPAVVVCNHGDGGVAEFRFASELRFRHVGHANDFPPMGTMEIGFGKGGELRPLHANIGAPAMHGNAGGHASICQDGRELRAGRLVKGDVSDDAVAKESRLAALGAIDKLIHDQEFPRAQILLKRADSADGNDTLHAEKFHGVDVGPEIQLAGSETMAAAVTREKYHPLAFDSANNKCIGRLAERGLDADFARVREAAHEIEATAADNADFRDGAFCPRTLPLRFSCLRHSHFSWEL